jgi:hypothetical protein
MIGYRLSNGMMASYFKCAAKQKTCILTFCCCRPVTNAIGPALEPYEGHGSIEVI